MTERWTETGRLDRHLATVRPAKAVTPQPKAPPRVIDPDAGRAKLRAEGRCRLCSRPGHTVQLSRHHLIPRGQLGGDVDANLVPLCGHGSAGCHGDVEQYRNQARAKLRARLTEDEIRYVYRRMAQLGRNGEAWLDASYPNG